MIYNNPVKIFLFFLSILIVIVGNFLFLRIPEAYCVICSDDIDTYFKKKFHCKVDIAQQLKQLMQVSDAHSQCLIQLQQQLSETQQDLDKLRGHIQNIQHHIAEITNDQKELYKKLDQILSKNGNKSLYYNDEEQPPHLNNFKMNMMSNDKIKKNTTDELDIDYKTAVGLVLEKKQYTQAIQAFQDFIKKYSTSCYHANAHYWLGQLYYNQGNKHDASYHFALVVKNYSKSSKAADALLKIGMIMQEQNQIEKAKIVYRQVGKLYPNSGASKQAQKRLLHLS